MMEQPNVPQPQTAPGTASAEDGLVILDGPNGVAITMTPYAAQQTAASLISAAEIATRQIAGREAKTDV